MKSFPLITFLLVLLSTGLAGPARSDMAPEDVLRVTPYVSMDGIPVGTEFKLALKVEIQKGWHINSNEPTYEFAVPTELILSDQPGLEVIGMEFPPATASLAVPGGGSTPLLEGSFYVLVRARATDILPGDHQWPGRFSYQSCDDKKCLRPVEKPVVFSLRVLPEGEKGNEINAHVFSPESAATFSAGEAAGSFFKTGNVSEVLGEQGTLVTLFLLFLGGLALNLTPCVYPIIPITIGYFAGQHLQEGQPGRGGTTLKAIAYSFGICLMYSILGVVAALSGRMFGAVLTHPAVLIGIALLMVALSMSLFGLYEFRMPTALMNLGGSARTGVAGALLMGLTMGIVAAPCIGPFVVGLLAWVASKGDPFIGFVVFFTLSLGLGLPYLLLGLFSGRMARLPRAGEWMVGVRKIFGVVLLLMAVYFLEALMPERVFYLVMSVGLIAAGAFIALWIPSGRENVLFHFVKTAVVLILVIAGTWILKPSPEAGFELKWQPYSEERVARAITARTPVVIDFYADWCIPCKELDQATFKDEALKKYESSFVFLKGDLSTDSPMAAQAREKYGIRGVPTVIFLRADGRENVEARLTGFEDAKGFVRRLEQTLKP